MADQQPTSPARFAATMRFVSADTCEAPYSFRQAEALKACLTTLRSIGYGEGCDVVAEILGEGK